VRLRRIVEGRDERVFLQDRLDDAALHADTSSVNQADFSKARLVRGADVFLHHRRNVARMKGVQVERIFDRNAMDRFFLPPASCLLPPASCLLPCWLLPPVYVFA
jgi:hypothetical protein